MEALSPLDANTHIRKNHIMKQSMKQNLKPLPTSVKQNSKETETSIKPPSEVFEPTNTDQKDSFSYKVGRLLGRGGFAVCHEGQNTTTKRIFALKIVQSHMPQKKMEQKFQTELQIHSKMRHANIVEFHRAFSYQKYTYIVLELCPNGSLMDIVKKRTFVTEPEVRFWIVQMAGAVKYMHGKGVIHRDLKMGNIFLDKNMNVKIGDFGLAALLMSGKDLQACRRTTLCGTPNYIAPEILSKDKGGHDHAVDIWSLGIIVYALLTGKPPFQSATANEIYRRARERDYDWPALGKSKNHISMETKNLVSELLQAPHQRPEPDKIVQHPFFRCGWTPRAEDMTVALRERHPDSTHFFSGNNPERSIDGYKNLQRLCINCEVGPWTPPRRYKSTYREVAEEEKFGLTPAVPMAGDVIYRPFHIWLQEKVKHLKENGERSGDSIKPTREIAPPVPKKLPKNGASLRPAVQSFAAQQRTRNQVPNNEARIGLERESQASLAIINNGSVSSLVKSQMKAQDAVTNVEDRLVINMLNQLKFSDNTKSYSKPVMSEKFFGDSISIFDKTEKIQPVPNTTPESILNRLHILQAELERALNSRSMAIDARTPKRSPVIVVKWVDYTNKFGLGYVLSNGSVGTLFRSISAFHHDKSKSLNPPSCVLVRDSETHLINQNNPDWPDHGQLVPMSGHNIEFFENRGSKGLFSTEISPDIFRSIPGPNGELFKLSAGKDEFDNRKRERVALWRKFGNYMTQYGRDADYPHDEVLNSCTDTETSDRHFVTFYQRWGDVGCWSFDDGHLQFNFPDHTKIILSADGTWCDFYHLSVTAARELAEKGTLSARALDERQHLSYPLQTMLNFLSKTHRSKTHRQPEIDPKIQQIPQANDLRRKIKFIVSCVKEWTQNGGIGISDLSVKGRLRWFGARQTVGTKIPYKQVWVSVGGLANDDRKVMWFDPRVPDFILPDIDT